MRRLVAVALRVLPVGALTLVVTGCVEEAYTPSELLPRAQPEPDAQQFVLPTRDEAIQRWQLPPSSPWAPYAKYTLLTALDTKHEETAMPQVGALDVVQAASRAGASVGAAGLPNDALWIVDMRGAASVAFGTALSSAAREPVALVPTFNNWPAENELVPAEETLAAMVTMTPPDPPPAGPEARPVFLLDAWRLAYKDEEVDDDVTDNRYMLTSGDFPSPEALRARGISRIVYVVENRDDVTHEEDDLNDLFLAYGDAGIEVDVVDLDWLEGVPREVIYTHTYGGWWVRLGGCRYVVLRRGVVVHDPRFYGRARGGFGGVHGVPHFGGGVHWGGHGGG